MYALQAPTGEFYVAETSEVVRVRQLERRDWQKRTDLDAIVSGYTSWLQHTPAKCTPRCTCCKYVDKLNPAQAVFLSEVFSSRGRVVAPFRTGGGKTLAALLYSVVLEKVLGRPLKVVYVVPANGRAKAALEARDYAKHWRVANVTIVSYETLAHPNHADWLERAAPDVILLDESHKAKNPRSKSWGRITKYIKARLVKGLTTHVCPFTASYVARSIKESWHYTRVAMGDRAPLPASKEEAEAWAAAMDEKVDESARLLPGALATLGPWPTADIDRVSKVRSVFGSRFVSTPGVVATMDGVPPVTVKLFATELEPHPAVADAVKHLRKHKVLPNGDAFESAMRVWAVARQLGCELYYRFDPPPPRAWVEARKAWYGFVLNHLAHSRKIDSIVHVANGVDRGEIADGGTLAAWRAVKDLYKYRTVDEWIGDGRVLKYAQDWLAEHPQGLCWVDHTAFGHELARRTGLPYFGEEARDMRGRHIVTYEGGPAIVSVHSCRTQFNLQGWFADNLIVSPLSTGEGTEQLIGRTVRDGHCTGEVTVEFLLTVSESYRDLAQAFADARASSRLEGGQPKKLCYGECMDSVIESIKNGEHEYAST